MAKLMTFADDDRVLIAVRTPADAVAPVGVVDDVVEKIDESLGAVMSSIRHVADSVVAAFDGLDAESAVVELGFQFTGKGRLYVVESAAQASLKVTLTIAPSAP